ncbi:UbiA family prenyltransferase [Sagittula sp. NFXS13]|uniref:UbiA family prenyltransferase n=1 Tax=Sagittula sp. NFXS13 TaxID=2819095 RepID=UPI0032DFBF7F
MGRNDAAASAAPEAALPLYVDLDGTLVRTDVAQELLLSALKTPRGLGALISVGPSLNAAQIKRVASENAPVQADLLPYRDAVVAYARAARAEGRRVVLATAADVLVAKAVVAHLGCFDAVLASTPERNLKGQIKLEAIKADCAGGPFEYLGDSPADLPIWRAAAVRGFVNPQGSARSMAQDTSGQTSLQIEDARPIWRCIRKAMRPHQWLKNTLLFLPLFFAHTYDDLAVLGHAVLAFVAFSLLTSGTYLVNDLFDIDADRRHPKKRNRPFAAGDVSPLAGSLVALGLIVTAMVLAFGATSTAFGFVLISYLVLTMIYTFALKNYSTIDVVILGLLFTIRIVAGASATGILVSAWLLTFSLFFFTSLAYLKRSIELMKVSEETKLPSRNYWGQELSIVQSFGITTAALSLLTLAQYITSDRVQASYPGKDLLWLVIPLLMFWTYRIWMWASRGKVEDDPVLFALKDRISQITILLMMVVVVAARQFTIPSFLL